MIVMLVTLIDNLSIRNAAAEPSVISEMIDVIKHEVHVPVRVVLVSGDNPMSKMTDTIKKVQAAAEAVLERAINPEEVIQAIEAIEVLVGAAQATQQHTITTMAETVPAAPAATESSAKPKRRYKKRKSSVRIVNWDKHTAWLDLVLNGGIHVVSTKNLGEIMTSKGQITQKLRKDAKRRGFKTVYINWNDKNRSVRIHAIK